MNKKELDVGYINIAIPQDVENMQLPNPELLTFYKNYEDRTLWIDSEINDYSIEYAKYIMQWNKEDKDAGIKKNFQINFIDDLTNRKYAQIYSQIQLPTKYLHYILNWNKK